MKPKITIALMWGLFFGATEALPYPSAPVVTREKSCLTCHVNNGPWKDNEKTIIDIIDQDTGKSLKQSDGTFLIAAKQGEVKTILTVVGRVKDDDAPAPYRNGWLYIDPMEREKGLASSSKFAPGWEVNLALGCRLVGDKLAGFEGANISVASLSLRPTEQAKDAEIQLQAMLTRGESVKGKPREGMIGNYFERKVRLKVIEAK